MTSQRFLAFVLIALQAVALGLQSQTVLFPLIVTVAAAWGMASQRRLNVSREGRWRLAGLTAAFFCLKYLLAPHDIPLDRMFIRTPLAFAAGQCLLVIQVAYFFFNRLDDACGELPLFLPGLGVVALICFAAVRVDDHERLIYQVLVISFVLFTPLYFRATMPGRRDAGRAVASALSLVAVAAVGWLTAANLYRYERSIETFLGRLLAGPEHHTGYSESGSLGSVTRRRGDDAGAVAILADGPTAPGYLRGRAFDEFHRSHWRNTSRRSGTVRSDDPPQAVAARAGTRPVFIVSSRSPVDSFGQAFELWPAAWLEDATFAPFGATHIAVDARDVLIDRHGILDAGGAVAGRPYVVFCRDPLPDVDAITLPPAPRPSTDGDLAPFDAPVPSATAHDQTLTLPDRWRTGDDAAASFITSLSEQIFRAGRTRRENIAAVEQFFRKNFRYSPSIDVPTGEDPLLYFLRSRTPAYCEYFASAAALLLRTQGIPTRYVTGFVANERQRFGGYWLARSRDAHAWAEAWIDGEGWVLVEATPAAGVPADAPPATLVALWEFLRDGLWRFRTRLSRDGPRVFLELAVRLLASPLGWALAALLAGRVLWRRRHQRRSRLAATRSNPTQLLLARLLRRMDARLRREGWLRAASETLHAFAERLEHAARSRPDLLPAAAWYRRYAAIRYGPAAEPGHLRRLREIPIVDGPRRRRARRE